METQKDIAEKVKERFPEAVKDAYSFRGQQSIVVDKNAIVDVCRFLKETPELDFSFLVDLAAVDYPERDVRFEVVYNIFSISQSKRIFLRIKVDSEDMVAPSVTCLWQSANWTEREIYDLFGITFSGHPNLKRLYMPDDFQGHPLRKEFPLGGEEPV